MACVRVGRGGALGAARSEIIPEVTDLGLVARRHRRARPASARELADVAGYQRYGENITQGKADHHEGLDLYAANPYPPIAPGERAKPLQGENQYPPTPTGLKPALEAWVEKMHVLGQSVMHAMAHGLGMDEDEWRGFWKLSDKSFWSMRLIGELSSD